MVTRGTSEGLVEGGGDEHAGGVVLEGGDGVGVTAQLPEALAGDPVPHTGRAVVRARHHVVGVGLQAADGVLVARKLGDGRSLALVARIDTQVPDLMHWYEPHAALAFAPERTVRAERGANAYPDVGAAGDDGVLVEELAAPDRVLVGGDTTLAFAGLHVPHWWYHGARL